jgi:hypothetical protein
MKLTRSLLKQIIKEELVTEEEPVEEEVDAAARIAELEEQLNNLKSKLQ